MADAQSQPGNMFAVPPKDRTPQQSSAADVNVSWPEYFILRRIPERFQIPYLVWRLKRQIARTYRDQNAHCPACGNRSGEIRWSNTFAWPDSKIGALIHQCKVCKAAWGEKPIVAYDDWKITLKPQEEQSLFGEVRRSA